MMVMKRPQPVQPIDIWADSRPLPWLIDLSEWLRLTGNYGPAERSRILTSLLDHGTFVRAVECGLLDEEDHALIEAIYVESQPPVPYDDPSWDCADTWELGPPSPPGAVLTPPELDERLQAVGIGHVALESKVNWIEWRKKLGLPTGQIPPISGGSPEADDIQRRLEEQRSQIAELSAQLAAIPDDWRLYYYPF